MASLNRSESSREMVTFFQEVYHQDPQMTSGKKGAQYSVPKSNVSGFIDKFKNCHINIDGKIDVENTQQLQNAIRSLTESIKKNNELNALWINFSVPFNSQMLAVLPPEIQFGISDQSNMIYDFQEKKIRYWLWLNPNKECSIPPGATHNMGATMMLVDREARKALLVQDGRGRWKPPGGNYDPSKDQGSLEQTAFRELKEELNLDRKNLEIQETVKEIGSIEFPGNPFAPAINKIFAVYVRNAQQLPLHPNNEIKKVAWVPFDTILKNDQWDGAEISSEVRGPLEGLIHGLAVETLSDKGWMKISAVRATAKPEVPDSKEEAVNT